jgi:hypothetical protein
MRHRAGQIASGGVARDDEAFARNDPVEHLQHDLEDLVVRGDPRSARCPPSTG